MTTEQKPTNCSCWAYAKPNKNIDECFDYVVGEARKQGGNAVYVPDEVVFGWAVHYYDEDDIKVRNVVDNAIVSASANETVDLSEADKDKAREKAFEEYKNQCLRNLSEADKAKRAKRKQIEATSPSLFD